MTQRMHNRVVIVRLVVQIYHDCPFNHECDCSARLLLEQHTSRPALDPQRPGETKRGLTALRHVTDRVRAYGCVVAAAALLSSGLACADAPLQPIATRVMPTSTGPRTNVTTVVNSRAATVYSAPADFDVATTGVALTTVDFSVGWFIVPVAGGALFSAFHLLHIVIAGPPAKTL